MTIHHFTKYFYLSDLGREPEPTATSPEGRYAVAPTPFHRFTTVACP